MSDQNKEQFIEKAKEIFSDEEFTKSLFEMDGPKQVQQALKEKGLDLSEEEIMQMRDLLIRAEKEGLDELSENDLENVAGGSCIVGVSLVIVGVLIAGGTTAGFASLFSGARW